MKLWQCIPAYLFRSNCIDVCTMWSCTLSRKFASASPSKKVFFFGQAMRMHNEVIISVQFTNLFDSVSVPDTPRLHGCVYSISFTGCEINSKVHQDTNIHLDLDAAAGCPEPTWLGWSNKIQAANGWIGTQMNHQKTVPQWKLRYGRHSNDSTSKAKSWHQKGTCRLVESYMEDLRRSK